MKPYENGGPWMPAPGWTHSTKRYAYHDCGWSAVHPAEEAGAHIAAVEAHAAVCCWPEMPEPVETPDG